MSASDSTLAHPAPNGSYLRAGFMPRTAVSLLVLAISFAIASLIYAKLQEGNQEKLYDAWLAADPIPAFCAGYPHLAPDICTARTKAEPDADNTAPDDLSQVIYALFLASEVIEPTAYPTAQDFSEKLPDALHAVRARLAEQLASHRAAPDQGETPQTGLELITQLSEDRCRNQNLDRSSAQQVASTAAYILTDGPGGGDGVFGGARSCSDARAAIESGMEVTWSAWRLSTSSCLGPKDAMRMLTQRAGAIPTGADGSPGYRVSTVEGSCVVNSPMKGTENNVLDVADFLAAQDHMTRIIETLISEMSTTTAIKDATTQLRMWRGIEHIGIMGLSIFVILIITLRIVMLRDAFRTARPKEGIKTDQHDFAVDFRKLSGGGALARRDYDEGGAFIRWATASIPAIGFIGTVRGIFSALPESSGVVFATSRIERAEAIGGLAGELGLAFSTTLFALVAVLLLNFIILLATRHEALQLSRLRTQMDQMATPKETAS